ncbi:MAG TPA: methyltransferase domain-containing protein [Thermoanaerobaculia bacterium]|nr:methyltransferase domain-containing protein [Thermoanaerobaculia bacterium]
MLEVWQSADWYEAYIGRWSRPVARKFVADLSIASGSVWLDVGCGSGALTSAIAEIANPARVVALDRSVEFVEEDRRRSNDGRIRFVAGDAVSLPFDDDSADAAVSGLVLNFVPQPDRALREMLRCVRAGGVVSIYLWDYSEGMQSIRLFWDAAIALDPRAVELDEAKRFPLCQPAPLEKLFADAGVAQVGVSSITVPTHFRDFDDLWSPFLGGQGPAPAYAMSLPDRQRTALRERLREIVPVNADGSIDLSASAWVARGHKM